MIESVWLFLGGSTFLFMILAFLDLGRDPKTGAKKPVPYFAWIGAILALSTMWSSASIEFVSCDYAPISAETTANVTNYTLAWDCGIYNYEVVPLWYFWFGVFLMMLIYAFYITFIHQAEAVINELRDG